MYLNVTHCDHNRSARLARCNKSHPPKFELRRRNILVDHSVSTCIHTQIYSNRPPPLDGTTCRRDLGPPQITSQTQSTDVCFSRRVTMSQHYHHIRWFVSHSLAQCDPFSWLMCLGALSKTGGGGADRPSHRCDELWWQKVVPRLHRW